MSSSGANNLLDPDGLLVGQSTMKRREVANISVPSSNQILRLTFFTATKSFTATQVRTITGNTAAAATPTLCRVGLYREETNGDITLIAATANDTTLWAATLTPYVSALTTPGTITAGQRYAVGILVVSGVATPAFNGSNIGLGNAAEWGIDERLSAAISGQADLPASVASASVTANGANIYSAVLP